MRCIACDRPLGYVIKKKPVTPYNNGMKDKFRDKIEEFPYHEEEEYCHVCRGTITGSNSDLNDQCVTHKDLKFYKYIDNDLGIYDREGLDNEAMMVDSDYQGWGEEIADKMYSDHFEGDWEG